MTKEIEACRLDDTDKEIIVSSVNLMVEKFHGNSLAHGFHDDLEEIKSNLRVIGRHDLAETVDLMSGGMKIALMHSELSEGLEGLRKGLTSDKVPEFTAEEEELADAFIRIMDRAGEKNLRLGEAIIAKHEYNLGRPFKHGKKF